MKCSLFLFLFSPTSFLPHSLSFILPTQYNSEFKRRLKAIEMAKKKAEKKVRRQSEANERKTWDMFFFPSSSTSPSL